MTWRSDVVIDVKDAILVVIKDLQAEIERKVKDEGGHWSVNEWERLRDALFRRLGEIEYTRAKT